MDPVIEQAVELLEQTETQDETGVSDQIQSAIDAIQKIIDIEGNSVRLEQLREIRQLVFYYEGWQYSYWDKGAQDYRLLAEHPNDEIRALARKFRKIYNIFKAHTDSIIAAISVGTPSVVFFPEDAEDPDDIDASRAYSEAQEFIMSKNNPETFFAEALFILATQHFVAAHVNYETDAAKYGTDREPIYKDVEYTHDNYVCPMCQETIGDEPDEIGLSNCPNCGQVIAENYPETEVVNELAGYDEYPKGREVIELFGSLNVKIPLGITDQKCAPYLIRDKEEHVAYLKQKYPHIADKITPSVSPSPDESWARRPYPYTDAVSLNQATERLIWLTPAAYNLLGEEEADFLRQSFPKGLRAAYVGQLFAEVVSEELAAHWRISKSPTSRYLHQQPAGRILVPIQDATNDLLNLTEETVKHAIPETFVNPRALDFEAYSQSEAAPGAIYPTKVISGDQPISHHFFERKPATLSQEVAEYSAKLDEMGQFLPGDFPSVFGGVIQGGSGTAKEYELSRAAALQRLALTWKQINAWFPHVAKIACDDLFANMRKPERMVKKSGSRFVNIFIKKPAGSIGEVRAESIEDFPMSWAQKSDRFFNLLGMNNPIIMSAAQDPENADLVRRLTGIKEARIPGSDDREKQLREIQAMSQVQAPPPEEQMQPEPEIDPQTGEPLPPPPPEGFIPPDEFDNHMIHAETTRAYLISPEGLDLRNENPYAYQLLTMHWQAHNSMIQPPATEPPAEGEAAPEGEA